MPTDTIAAFLPYTASQKSVSLIIAKSELLADDAIAELESRSFKELEDVHDLGHSGTYYIRVSEKNAKEMYDIAIQYGTGQITVYDPKAHRTSWINPRYGNSGLVFVITEETLHAVEQSGLYLRSIVGLTTQM